MKITIEPDALRAVLTVATSTISPRSSHLPALSGVLLNASIDGGLTATGTDTESRSWHTVQAVVEAPGGVVLPPKALADFLDAVTETITLTVNAQHKAELVSGRTKIKVAGLDAEDMPRGSSFDAPSFDTAMPADLFAGAVKSVAHAVAPDDSRPVLAGVLLQLRDGKLTLAAADGYRLALRTIEVDAPDLYAIAHGKMLAKAAGMVAKATSVRLIVDERASALLIDFEVGCWSVRLIEGQFPDFNRIIPRDPPHVVTVGRDALLRATRLIRNTMTTVADGGGKTHTVTNAKLSVMSDSIEVRARTNDGDQEAESVIEATVERGDGVQITFDGAYFRDAVEAVDAPLVTLELVGPMSPAIVRPSGPSRGQTFVLMPRAEARA